MTESMRLPPRPIRPLPSTSREPFVARIPGSKSYTVRALVLAAMRMGTTAVAGALDSDDTRRLARALGSFGGLQVEPRPDGFRTTRTAAVLEAPAAALDLGGAAAPARFLLAFAAAAHGATVVTGSARLCERPMGDLIATLRAIGIRCDCLGSPDRLPVRVHGGAPAGRSWRIGAGVSSQFTSALLLYASQLPGGPVEIALVDGQVSQPYVEMTRAMLRQCGIGTERRGDDRIVVHPAAPQLARIVVEPDASSMSYFLAAAAVTGTAVEIPGIGEGSVQGDVGLVHAFARMGCAVALAPDRIRLAGGPLRGIDLDMGAMPDVVLTLAAVAARARGGTRITNVANLRVKECDRIQAAAAELARLGQRVEQGPDWLAIEPAGRLQPGRVHTYGDHRVAMAFAVLGLLQDGIEIEDPACVDKSFPGFWQEFERFGAHHAGGGR
jgi:3-phosphoshikimate 1-carboxyvinyltransferase